MKRRKTAGGVPTVAEAPLGEGGAALMNLFSLIDKLYCFMRKMKLPCSIDTIRAGVPPPLFQHLDMLLAVAPDTISVHTEMLAGDAQDVYAPQQEPRAVIALKPYSTTQSASTTRTEAVTRAIRAAVGLEDRMLFEGRIPHEGPTPSTTPLAKGVAPANTVAAPTDPDAGAGASTAAPALADSRTESLAGIGEGSVTANPRSQRAGAGVTVGGVFSPEKCVEMLKASDLYTKQIVYTHSRPPRDPEYAALDPPLRPAVAGVLQALGIKALYSHQAKAIDAARRGNHVMMTTATSSGKSVCYLVPIMETILAQASATAILMFPTKALAHDQLRVLNSIRGSGYLGDDVISAAVDGDADTARREEARAHANIILTNPDMLHATILPQQDSWARILRTLRFLVLDEAHVYRAAFGMNVSAIMRRLFRVCARFGNTSLQVICCSATLANPHALFTQLVPVCPCSRPLTVVSTDGSPCGERVFVLWNPPLVGTSAAALRARGIGPNEVDELTTADETAVEIATVAPDPDSCGRLTELKAPAPRAAAVPGPTDALPQENAAATSTVTEPPDQVAIHIDGEPVDLDALLDVDGLFSDEEPSTPPGNPPVSALLPKTSPSKRQIRVSSIFEAAMIAVLLVKKRVRLLVFCKVRKLVELVLKYMRRELLKSAPELVDVIAAYRGGYTWEERRQIERQLSDGTLLAVVATNALELGIDIGTLDCVLMLGHPGTPSSLWQQAGRAGRGTRNGLVIMVCFGSVADQYMARHPETVLERPVEAVLMAADNEQILRHHILCAAAEAPLVLCGAPACTAARARMRRRALPLAELPGPIPGHEHRPDADEGLVGASNGPEEASPPFCATHCCDAVRQFTVGTGLCDNGLFGPSCEGLVQEWVTARRIRQLAQANDIIAYTIASACRPSLDMNIRGANDNGVDVVTAGTGRVLCHIDRRNVNFEVYPGAVFLHQGETFVVGELDISEHRAVVHPAIVSYFTSVQDNTTIDPVSVACADPQLRLYYGPARVRTVVFGYRKYDEKTHQPFETEELRLPPWEFVTKAAWLEVDDRTKDLLGRLNLSLDKGLHAARHALSHAVPFVLGCDRSSVIVEHTNLYEQVTRPAQLLIADSFPGGAGVAEALFPAFRRLIDCAAALIADCKCRNGCPGCVHDLGCTEFNEVTDKRAAQALLTSMRELWLRAPPEAPRIPRALQGFLL
eukprot:m.90018 g.90018  ORF g.90018 m.90018 type:complete len:1201 (-) comp8439_c0_seq2:215-3817(-)